MSRPGFRNKKKYSLRDPSSFTAYPYPQPPVHHQERTYPIEVIQPHQQRPREEVPPIPSVEVRILYALYILSLTFFIG
jgi:hypothetical protein